MKFLCLICAEKVMEQMPEADAEKHFEEYRTFLEDIRRSGHYLDATGCCLLRTRPRFGCAKAKFQLPTGPGWKPRSSWAAIS